MLLLIRQSIQTLLALTLITGLAYPLAMTAFAQLFLPRQANGSLIVKDSRVLGSELIGQGFQGGKYFWPRPSATTPFGYNAASSSGSNLGPLSPDFGKAIEARVAALRAAHPQAGAIPMDLVTASGSGLDPHISPDAAQYQAARVAAARGLPVERVAALIAKHTAGRQFGIFGEPVVNVLTLNLELDGR